VQRKTTVSKAGLTIYANYMLKDQVGSVFVSTRTPTVQNMYERRFSVHESAHDLPTIVNDVVIGKAPECSCDTFKLNVKGKGYQSCWHVYAVFAKKVWYTCIELFGIRRMYMHVLVFLVNIAF